MQRGDCASENRLHIWKIKSAKIIAATTNDNMVTSNYDLKGRLAAQANSKSQEHL